MHYQTPSPQNFKHAEHLEFSPDLHETSKKVIQKLDFSEEPSIRVNPVLEQPFSPSFMGMNESVKPSIGKILNNDMNSHVHELGGYPLNPVVVGEGALLNKKYFVHNQYSHNDSGLFDGVKSKGSTIKKRQSTSQMDTPNTVGYSMKLHMLPSNKLDSTVKLYSEKYTSKHKNSLDNFESPRGNK